MAADRVDPAELKAVLAGLAHRLQLTRPAEPILDYVGRGRTVMVNFFIHRPVFASVIAVIMVLTGLIAYSLLPVAQFPGYHATAGRCHRQLPWRQLAGRRQHRDDPARATDQWRAGHGLHVVGQRQ